MESYQFYSSDTVGYIFNHTENATDGCHILNSFLEIIPLEKINVKLKRKRISNQQTQLITIPFAIMESVLLNIKIKIYILKIKIFTYQRVKIKFSFNQFLHNYETIIA